MLLLLILAATCKILVHGTAVPVLKDMTTDWTTVVSTGHLIEAFSTMGQLHILDPTVSKSKKSYNINIYSYGAMDGEDLEELTLKMEKLGKAGNIRWFLNSKSDKWKLSINSQCEKDFETVPTVSGEDNYHWIILLTDQMFYLKCNNVVVATVANNDDCYPKIGNGKLGIGGWELTDMVGFKTRFENIKDIASCSMPSYYYNKKGLIGVKKLTTGQDCQYDCQHTTGCKKATIDLTENSCKLYSSFGGQGRYINQQSVDTESRYLNYLFGTLVSFDMDCFDYKDDPCWREGVRFEIGAQETTIKSIKSCLDDHYKNGETAMWNPVTGMCSAIHDKYIKIAEIPAPGFSLKYSMCEELKKETSYQNCFEYGVILEGNVLSETIYKFPYDCKETCEKIEDCTGWSSVTELRRCYLYTGPVYKVSHPRSVSGTYDCLTDLAPVPQEPHAGRLVEPVSTNFNLLSVSEPGILNLYVGNDDVMRTVHIVQDGVSALKFVFYPRKQNGFFDFLIGNCAFNYTSQPCAYKRRPHNFYQIDFNNLAGISLYCGESAEEISDLKFFGNDLAYCGLSDSLTKWNGLKFENFKSDDKFSFGLTADFPKKVFDEPSSTYAPPSITT